MFNVYGSSPPVNGPKDPRPHVLSLPGAQGGFVWDPASLARNNIYIDKYAHSILFITWNNQGHFYMKHPSVIRVINRYSPTLVKDHPDIETTLLLTLKFPYLTFKAAKNLFIFVSHMPPGPLSPFFFAKFKVTRHLCLKKKEQKSATWRHSGL